MSTKKEKNRWNLLRIIKDTKRNVDALGRKNGSTRKQLPPAPTRDKNFFQGGNTKDGKELTKEQIAKQNEKLKIKNKNDDSKTSSSNNKTNSKSSGGSNVFTRHYKTGKTLGVMTRAQRRAYDKEAGGKTFEGQMKDAGLKKDDPRRETKFTSKRWQKRTKGGALKDNPKNRGSGRTGKSGKGTSGKSLPSNPKLKSQKSKTGADKGRDANYRKYVLKIKKKEEEEDKRLGSRLSKMFDN